MSILVHNLYINRNDIDIKYYITDFNEYKCKKCQRHIESICVIVYENYLIERIKVFCLNCKHYAIKSINGDGQIITAIIIDEKNLPKNSEKYLLLKLEMKETNLSTVDAVNLPSIKETNKTKFSSFGNVLPQEKRKLIK